MTELYIGKEQLIAKYGLKLNIDNYWYVDKENSHEQIMFKNSFFQKNDLIIILFRIYKLCFAKVNYFRRNIRKYESYKYHYQKGFIKAELWDAEFFRHIKSGYYIDFRFLQSITDIEVFIFLMAELEMLEDEECRDQILLNRLLEINNKKSDE